MKIALIAMSGLRTYNPELLKLGMTLPGFVDRGRAIASLPSLSLLTIAALTPERFDVTYHEIEDVRAVDILPPCDLAAISTYTAQAKEAYLLAGRYRREGVKTVIGGLHVTACPEEAAEHCDAVVAGEGELSWPQLLEDFEAGRLKRIYRPNGREFDLGEAPIPRFDLLDPDRYNRLTVQTQRGCPWRCEFCASSTLLTHRYKMKPVEKVISEIRAIKNIWGHPFIEFADDNTFVNKSHSRELMRALAEEQVRWFTETDVSVADDPELLKMMHDAGCFEILIGLESPNAGALRGLELNRNWKWGQHDRYRDAVGRIQSHGISVNACFILGLDGDGPEIFDAVERFIDETGPFDAQITLQTPFPGTPLYERLLREGRLIDKTAWEKYTLFDAVSRPLRMSVEELEKGLFDLAKRIYSEEATNQRRRAFREQWRRGSFAGHEPRTGAPGT